MPRTDEVLLEVLRQNRQDAIDLASSTGQKKLLKLLGRADADLTHRLSKAVRAPGRGTFTHEQIQVTRYQVREVVRGLTRGLGALVVDEAGKAADTSVGHLIDYLGRAEDAFRGISSQPLRLKEASILDQAVSGTSTTVLRRLASDFDEDGEAHPARLGILERYGLETVGRFEDVMQEGLISRKPWAEVRQDLVEESPFLQGQPRFWAERILRTETQHAMNRSAWEAQGAANQELGDLVKIITAVFDDRTAADSYATHGQIRRNEEPFQTWHGLMMHPPDRPNDRGSFVPHRMSWPIPPSLNWRSSEEISRRWVAEGRKGSPPPRPLMTTIPLGRFGSGEQP